VNVLRELDLMGWEYEFAGDDEIKCRCPVHGDKSPSCSINVTKKLWKCHTAGCGTKGDFVSFMAYATKGSREAILKYIRKEYDVENVKTIDSETIEKWHAGIWKAGPLLKELHDRGISDEAIRTYRLGVDDRGRITIPIKNASGLYVNARRYRPGAPTKDKMANTRGLGKIRLFPISQLEYDVIVVAGGECKAIAIAERLNEHSVGAICATGGEDNWDPSFTRKFDGKRVFICYDIDTQGGKGAAKVAAKLKPFAKWVGVMELPLEIDKYPTGDVNDWFGQEGATAEDFIKLMESTNAWEPVVEEEIEEGDAAKVRLAEVSHARHARRKVITNGVITALDTTPYLVPKDVAVECSRDQVFCEQCPVYGTPQGDDLVTLTIERTSPAIIELVNAGKKTKKEAIRDGLKMPPCKACNFYVRDHYNVEDVRLSPQLEIGSRSSDSIMLPAMTVSHGLEMNVNYEFEGRPYPHPRTQQAIFLVGESTPSEDALDSFNISDVELDELKIFQPREWTVESIRDKLTHVYDDLSANVTRIFDRQDLHLMIDLVYHSPLLLNFDGRKQEKGWVEGLVVGDSAQGKSEATKRLMEHYGLGEKIEVKNASVAGLLGGLAQLGNRWMVQWGIIPRHDRRLVVLEELKGASVEIISKLTDMRSTGVAEIEKIEKRRTHARTRLLALSNPRSEQPLASYSYGVEAARELVGSPEDLRRFDVVLVVAAGEVAAERLNLLSSQRPSVDHVYTEDLCRRAVLWGWTRHEDQVVFEEDAEVAVLNEANLLCSRYDQVVPIIDRGSTRYKLARLAASLAVRTASFGLTNREVRVRECHVKFVSQWLDEVYSNPVNGYLQFSEAYRSTRRLNSVNEIRKRLLSTPFPDDFLEQMLHCDAIEQRDVCDWTGWDRDEARELISFLVRKHALIRNNRFYQKNPAFVDLMRELQVSDDMKRVIRPDHIKEKSNDEF